MSPDVIERDFKAKICEQVNISAEGVDRYRVLTPFMFDDGDHLVIVLRKQAGRWQLSDEGHTHMRLTYALDEQDLERGARQEIIADALSAFSVEDREGELILPVPDDRYGDALYGFVQAPSSRSTT